MRPARHPSTCRRGRAARPRKEHVASSAADGSSPARLDPLTTHDPDKRKPADTLTAVAIVALACMYLLVRWLRMLSLGGGFDSTLLGNVLWRLANGLNSQTALTGGHYVSTHASPILALFVPIFRASPELGMPMVFAAQTASVALVGWAGYLVGGHKGLTVSTRRWLLAALFASPAAWLATQHQVNETTLGIGPLAMAMALSLRGDRLRRLVPWAILAASCRMEMAAAVLVAGMVVWSFGRPRQGRTMVLMSVAFLAGYVSWLFLNPYETESLAAHFAHLGSTPTEVVAAIVARPWAVVEPIFSRTLIAPIMLWLLPFGLVAPLFRPRWLTVALPTAAVAILGVWPAADNPIAHYWYAFLAAGAMATPIAISANEWLRSRLRVLLVAGVMLGWVIISPLYSFFVPAFTLDSSDRSLAQTIGDLGPGFVSAPGALSFWLIDRPLLALFPRPFRCDEEAIGPYRAPDIPPEVIIMPNDALDLLDDETSSRLDALLASYERVARSENYEAWQVVDADRAAIDYVPCSSSTFTPSV